MCGYSPRFCFPIVSLLFTSSQIPEVFWAIFLGHDQGNWQLDNSIQSKIVAIAFSMAAEIERDLISQRTKEALRAKKAAGHKLGRPKSKGPGKSKLDP